MTTLSARFRTIGGTVAEWAADDIVPLEREVALETDTGKFKFGDGVSAYSALPYAKGAAAWGDITGTLSAQTDLQAALDGKEPTITAGTTAQYWRGDKSWQTLDKTAVGLGNLSNTVTGTGAVVLASGPTIDALISTGVARFGTTNPGTGTVRIGAGANALAVYGSGLTNGQALAEFSLGTITGTGYVSRMIGTTSGNLIMLLQQNGAGTSIIEAATQGAGDAFIRLSVSASAQQWSVGVDNSDSDAFTISGAAPGTGNALRIDASTKAVTTYGPMLIGSDTLRITTELTPASATATGTKGDICWDANYLYICIAANTWRRIAHATW